MSSEKDDRKYLSLDSFLKVLSITSEEVSEQRETDLPTSPRKWHKLDIIQYYMTTYISDW